MFEWRAYPMSPRATSGAYLTVPALRSAGIRVAFTGRAGGVSDGAYASLNLSLVAGDDPESVRLNRRRVLETIGAETSSWTSGQQVHGAGVACVGSRERGRGSDSPDSTIPGTDGLWTAEPGVTLAVLTADCVPIVLADPARRRAGVAHAGWRGLVGGVVEATVEAIGPAATLSAYVGPSIGPCCYEVGDDVADAAAKRFGGEVVRRDSTQRLDLWRGALRALTSAGVRDVRVSALCTRCESHRFFSHRAGHAARQGALVTIQDAAS